MNETQRQVIRAFREHRVRYLVVGGQAMRSYGIDRRTQDLDLWVARDMANAQAITRFMRQVQNLPPLDRLQQPNFKFTVGHPGQPDVDILTSVAGDPQFDVYFGRSDRRLIDGLRLPVINPSDLLLVKQASAVKMEEDQHDPALEQVDRQMAQRTAEKERRDIMLLNLYINNLPAPL
ncbi:hypothetical protein [Aquabacterium commune]|nr:hypothetical protein [Aquabacterium commune]